MHERERELNIVLRRFLRRANFKWLPTGRAEGWVGAYKGEQTSSAAAAANKQQYKEKQSSSSTKAASPAAAAAAANCRLNPVLSGPQLCDPHHVAISYFVPSSVFMLFAFSYLANLVWTQIM